MMMPPLTPPAGSPCHSPSGWMTPSVLLSHADQSSSRLTHAGPASLPNRALPPRVGGSPAGSERLVGGQERSSAALETQFPQEVADVVRLVRERVEADGYSRELCGEIQDHFSTLPLRYALSVDPKRHDDILLHMRLLSQARRELHNLHSLPSTDDFASNGSHSPPPAARFHDPRRNSNDDFEFPAPPLERPWATSTACAAPAAAMSAATSASSLYSSLSAGSVAASVPPPAVCVRRVLIGNNAHNDSIDAEAAQFSAHALQQQRNAATSWRGDLVALDAMDSESMKRSKSQGCYAKNEAFQERGRGRSSGSRRKHSNRLKAAAAAAAGAGAGGAVNAKGVTALLPRPTFASAQSFSDLHESNPQAAKDEFSFPSRKDLIASLEGLSLTSGAGESRGEAAARAGRGASSSAGTGIKILRSGSSKRSLPLADLPEDSPSDSNLQVASAAYGAPMFSTGSLEGPNGSSVFALGASPDDDFGLLSAEGAEEDAASGSCLDFHSPEYSSYLSLDERLLSAGQEQHGSELPRSDSTSQTLPRQLGWEVFVASSSVPGLLSMMTSALSDDLLDLDIREAHVFSTSDGFALLVFVVAGWSNDDTEELEEAISSLVADRWRRGIGLPKPPSLEEKHERLKDSVERLSFEDWTIDFNDLIIHEKLGGGGSGRLYRGDYKGQDVAIKVMSLESKQPFAMSPSPSNDSLLTSNGPPEKSPERAMAFAVPSGSKDDFWADANLRRRSFSTDLRGGGFGGGGRGGREVEMDAASQSMGGGRINPRNNSKVISPLGTAGGQSADDIVRCFRQEVAIMKMVRHKNVVQFIGACSHWPRLFIVTELMECGSVRDVLDDSPGGLPPYEAAKFLRDAARGLDFLHRRGVIHRDLKAANLLLDENNVVKICDFGVARLLPRFSSPSSFAPQLSSCTEGSMDSSGNMTAETGTYRWMAPEVLEHKPYDQRADIYSLGVTFWEMLTGLLPYDGLTPLQAAFGVLQRGLRPPLPASLPPVLATIIERCWDKDPEMRPPLCDVIEQLDAYLKHEAKAHKNSQTSQQTHKSKSPWRKFFRSSK